MTTTGSDDAPRQRIDKFLWHARFFKTRGLAARTVAEGRVRLNGARVAKASTTVRPDDVLTFPQGDRVRVVAIRALPHRRGPSPEAQACYEDRTPEGVPPAPRAGRRPTGRDRRRIDALRDGSAGKGA